MKPSTRVARCDRCRKSHEGLFYCYPCKNVVCPNCDPEHAAEHPARAETKGKTQMAEGKVTRRLTIKIQPISRSNYSVTFNDGTTRAMDGKRLTEGILTADSFSAGALLQAFSLQFAEFEKSLANESQDDLFGDQKSAKPKLDQ